MRDDPPASQADLAASRPPPPDGAVRRLSHALLQSRLFGAPLPRLGRFEVRRKLGEGGMGAVFEADDPTLGRTVALKLLRHAEGGGPRPDPAHEARMLARLSHPNVVTVYELGEAEPHTAPGAGSRDIATPQHEPQREPQTYAPGSGPEDRAMPQREPQLYAPGCGPEDRATPQRGPQKDQTYRVGGAVEGGGLSSTAQTSRHLPPAPPTLYVCMAWVDGPNLAGWLARNPGAGWRERARLMRGAAAGLAAAHRAGVIHRDFKLENVLVGADGVARVTDFGLARADADPAPPGSSRAEGGPRRSGLAGTPGYLAPEVIEGGRATERSDQYALGIALRRCLAGVPDTPPEALARLVDAATAADPAARLPDLSAVVAALDAILARPSTPDQRLREVLLARISRLWVEPIRGRALSACAEAPLSVEAGDDASLSAALADAGGGPDAIAGAIRSLRARVALLGDPGAGKTLRLLAVADALRRRAEDDPDAPMPVILPLSGYTGFDGPFDAWVERELVARYALPRAQVAEWLAAGSLALLLDGLDELPPANRLRCAAALDAMHAARPAGLLLTCRDEGWAALAARPGCDALLRLRGLAADDLDPSLRRAGVPADAVAAVHADPALAEALRNPLLLSLFVDLRGGLSAGGADLRQRLYARALDHALDRPPALTGEDRARAGAAVRALAAMLERAGAAGLWLEDMQVSWLPTPAARGAAVALGVGSVFAASLAVNLAAAHVARLPWYSGAFFGLLAPAAALLIQGGVRITPMERMRWSWARVWRWIPGLIALGVLMGALHGIFFDLWADLLLGVATGLLGISVIGLVPAGRERRVVPGEGLIESLRNSLIVAPLVGLIIGAPVGYLVLPLARPLAAPGSMYHTHPDPSLAWAVTVGTSATVTSLLITGLSAPIMHAAVRAVLAATTPVPWRLSRWMDGLAERGIVHPAGGGWVFRHATFRAWLAGGSGTGSRGGADPGAEG